MNFINNYNYSDQNELSSINCYTLNTNLISNEEFNTLDGINTTTTIQQQINSLSSGIGSTGPTGPTGSASTVTGPTGPPGQIINTVLSTFPNQSTFVTTDATGFRWIQNTGLFPSAPSFTFTSGKTYLITGFIDLSTTNVNSTGLQVYLSTQDGVTAANYFAANNGNYEVYEYTSPGVQPRFGVTFSVLHTATSLSTTYGFFVLQTVSTGTAENAMAYVTTLNITRLN